MLIDFGVENFRSYREYKEICFIASATKELPENLVTLPEFEMALVRTAALYGANASGKSNLLLAMNALSDLLTSPMIRESLSAHGITPFALDSQSATKATKFRARFTLGDGHLYEYFIAMGPESVEEERLIAFPLGRAQTWFDRTGSKIDFNKTYLKGPKDPLRSMTSPKLPLLAVAGAFGHPQLSPVAFWLVNNLRDRFVSTDPRPRPARRRAGNQGSTARMCHENPHFRDWANAFLRHADVGIREVEIEVTEYKFERPRVDRAPDGNIVRSIQDVVEEHHSPYFVHSGDEGFTARFSLAAESHGTRRLFAMLAPVFEVLRDGQVALVDELSASLHPSLVRELLRVFHDPELNPEGAQLIFSTHDTSLLNRKTFRRDQIWFTEKTSAGASDLYSLHDIRGVREDDSFEKGYMRGRYGAIPFFGQFDFPQIPEEATDAPNNVGQSGA